VKTIDYGRGNDGRGASQTQLVEHGIPSQRVTLFVVEHVDTDIVALLKELLSVRLSQGRMKGGPRLTARSPIRTKIEDSGPEGRFKVQTK
jgi:hypothetical protein